MVFIENETKYYDILIPNEEAVYFDGVEDLSEKIRYYKQNKDKHCRLHIMVTKKCIVILMKECYNYMLDCLKCKDTSKLQDKYNWPIHLYN